MKKLLLFEYKLFEVTNEKYSISGQEVEVEIELLMSYFHTGLPISRKGIRPEWLDSTYSKPEKFEGLEFRLAGHSSKKTRNIWVCDVPSKIEKFCIAEVERNPYNIEYKKSLIFNASEYNALAWKEIELEFQDDNFVERLNSYLEEVAFQQSINEAPVVSSFTAIHEANKTHWYKYLNHLDGKNFIVLHEYRTTCGNRTLLLHPVSSNLYIPDGYKGIVIGKGGSNIRAISEKYKMKFKLK